MNKEQKNLAWACLPKEERNKIISVYACKSSEHPYDEGYKDALRQLYGHHNLTSDTEPEEMLMVERNFVIDFYKDVKMARWEYEDARLIRAMEQQEGKLLAMKYLFGDKCLPDKEPLQTSVKVEGKSVNLSQSSSICDKSQDNQLNLCELLKGCEGEWFYATPCGEIELKSINKSELKPLHFSRDTINCLVNTDGRAYENGTCIIYPSLSLYEKYPLDPYSAWMEWAEARKPKYELSGCIYIYKDGATADEIDLPEMNFNSLELAQQAAEGVREYLNAFHEKHLQQ